MNNEEKILAMLESMQSEIGGIKDEIDGIKDEIGGVKSELLKTNVCIEHEIMPKINLLYDGMTSLQENAAKKKDVSEEIDELRADLTMMKRLYMKLNA